MSNKVLDEEGPEFSEEECDEEDSPLTTSNNIVIQHMNMLVKKLEKINDDQGVQVVKKIKLDYDDSINKILNKLEEIEKKLEESKTSSESIKVVKLRCPVCYSEASSSTRFAQCINGHLLCFACKDKLGETPACMSCKRPLEGRAFGMEAYLKTVFGFEF